MATLITKNSSTASAVPAAGDLVKGELAVNVTDKKVYTKDNSAAVVKLVGSLGNQEANAVAITGGAINGTTIGATTPSTGAFTTASASSGFTGNLTGNVTGNVSGTAANVTGVVAIANGGTGLSALGTGVQSALGQAVTGSGSFVLSTSPSLTTPNLGTPSAAVLTNATGLPLTTGVTGTLGVANGGTGITAFGTGVATALGQNVTGSGGIVLATSPSLTTPNLGTPSAATLTNATGLPISTGVSGLGTGVATALAVATGSAGAFVVNGGALGTPSGGTLTNCTGYPTSALSGSINLATQVTGTLGTTNGGTGLTSFTSGGAVYATSTSALTTGTLPTTAGGTGLTSFTANGVVYASSTSALTTGSALTFSSGIFGVSDSSSPRVSVEGSSTASGYLIFKNTTSGLNRGYIGYEFANDAMPFAVNGSEQMRLTSTGLGIGTSSPQSKLHIQSTVGTAETLINLQTAWNSPSGNKTIRWFDGSGALGAIAVNYTAPQAAMTFGSLYNSGYNTTDLMTLTPTGLGIGTSSPNYRLDVAGTANATALGTTLAYGTGGEVYSAFRFNNSSFSGGNSEIRNIVNGAGSIGSAMAFFTSQTGSGSLTERLRIDNQGNLGLGVTPSAWDANGKGLQVGNQLALGFTNATGPFVGGNAYYDGLGWKRIGTGAATAYLLGGDGAHIWYSTSTSGSANSAISFTQAMTLDASGNLLVGTTSPTPANANGLIAYGGTDAGILYLQRTTGTDQLRFYVGGNRLGYLNTASSAVTLGTANYPLIFSTNDTERARIDSDGNLLVGTTSGTQRFVVSKEDSGSYVARFTNTTGSNANGVYINTPNRAGSNALFGLTVANSGGNAFAIYTDGTYGTISDINRKKNVETTRDGYLADLCSLRVVKYHWKEQEDSEPKSLGFIAQEIEQVFAGLVQTDENGQKMIKQPVLIPMLVKALQEMKQIVDAQAAEIAALKSK